MASGDTVLGALLLQRQALSPDKLSWAIGEMLREHSLGQTTDLQSVLTRYQLVSTPILKQIAFEARSGGSAYDLDIRQLQWMQQTVNQHKQRLGLSQRPSTNHYSASALQAVERPSTNTYSRATLNQGSEVRMRASSEARRRRRHTTTQAPAGLRRHSQTDNQLARPSASSPGVQVWGRYEIQGEIGRGAMGAVYRAFDLKQDRREVAIKVLLQGAKARADVLERFRREARTLARLRHPAIVRVLDHGVYNNRAYIAMEFVAGNTLESKLNDMPLTRGLVLFEEIADALDHAHNQDVVHRDLKPSNILIGTDGKPKIMDFGLAKILDESNDLTRQGDLVGTPLYMSPEQICGDLRATGPMLDLWGFGVSFYSFLTKELPFNGQTVEEVARKVQKHTPPWPSEVNPQIPTELSHICMTLLEKTIDDRYQSARDLADDIRRYLRGEDVLLGGSKKSESRARPKKRARSSSRGASRSSSRRQKLLLAIGALAFLIGILGGGLYLHFKNSSRHQTPGKKKRKSALPENRELELLLDKTASAYQVFGLPKDLKEQLKTRVEELNKALPAKPSSDPAVAQTQSLRDMLLGFKLLERCGHQLLLHDHSKRAHEDALSQQRAWQTQLKALSFKASESQRHLTLKNMKKWLTSLLKVFGNTPEQAIDELEELRHEQPECALAPLALAHVYVRQKQPSRALKVLNEALNSAIAAPQKQVYRLALCHWQARYGSLTKARELLATLKQQNPSPHPISDQLLVRRAVDCQLFHELPHCALESANDEIPPTEIQCARAQYWLDMSCPKTALAQFQVNDKEWPVDSLNTLKLWIRTRACDQSLDFEKAYRLCTKVIRKADALKYHELSARARKLAVELAHINEEREASKDFLTELVAMNNKRELDWPNKRQMIANALVSHGDALSVRAFFGDLGSRFDTGPARPQNVNDKQILAAIKSFHQALELPFDKPFVRRRLALIAARGMARRQVMRDHLMAMQRDPHPCSQVLFAFSQHSRGRGPRRHLDKNVAQQYLAARSTARDARVARLLSDATLIRQSYASDIWPESAKLRCKMALRRAFLLEPGDPLTLKELRRFYAALKDNQRGVLFGSVSFTIDPTDPDNYDWYASTQKGPQRFGLLKEGSKMAQIDSSPRGLRKASAMLTQFAEELLVNNQQQEAIKAARAALKQHPQNDKALSFLIENLSPDQDEVKDLRKLQRELTETNPERLQRALKALERKDAEGALELARKTQSVGIPWQHQALLWRIRGDAGTLKRSDDLKAWFEFTLAGLTDLSHLEALLAAADRVDLETREHLLDQCQKQFTRAARSQKRDMRLARSYHAFCLYLLKADKGVSPASRRKLFRKCQGAALRHPELIGAHALKACARLLAGAAHDAQEDLQLVLRHRAAEGPGGAWLHACLALSCLQQGREAEAKRALAKAQSLGFSLEDSKISWLRQSALKTLLKDSRVSPPDQDPGRKP